MEYDFDVPPGLYQVNCHWAETTYDTPGEREFNVLADGQTLVSPVDLLTLTPEGNAYNTSFYDINVQLPQPQFLGLDGNENPIYSAVPPYGILALKFVKTKGSLGGAMISALEVIGEQPVPTITPTGTYTPPPTITFTPTPSPTSTPSPTPAAAGPSPTYTFTPSPTGTLVPLTNTPTATPTVSPTASFTPVTGAYTARLEMVGPNVVSRATPGPRTRSTATAGQDGSSRASPFIRPTPFPA